MRIGFIVALIMFGILAYSILSFASTLNPFWLVISIIFIILFSLTVVGTIYNTTDVFL